MDAWDTLWAQLRDALGVFGEASVNAAAVILATLTVGIWRLSSLLRDRAAARAARTSSFERTEMTDTPDTHRRGRGFHVRWERTALAAVAVLALTVAAVTAVAALTGVSLTSVAVVAGVVALAAGGTLAALISRDSGAAPAEQAHEAAAPADAPAAGPTADPARDRRILDTVLALRDEPAAPATAAAPTPVAAAERPAAAPAPAPAVAVTSVPRPTYLDAPVVERAVPEPYAAEPVPAATARLKDGAGADHRERIVAERAQAEARAEADRLAEEQDSAEVTALDLDSVLARRRAS
ncbi:hypothetical protein [Micrococcus sp.]|uniref:hypothetical protein n=1 Tax=Micrococcus sp. TaxID=1271 RepID=UPI002A90EA70|nr:hypothetical protein [Micrococcus sp.]MDY6055811.1 hypothetical protein [Micrococcus sp.]